MMRHRLFATPLPRLVRGILLAGVAGAAMGSAHLGRPTAATVADAWQFGQGTDGGGPSSGLLLDPSGTVYGTTYAGGAKYGIVYSLAQTGKVWTETPIWSFTSGTDGADPVGNLIEDSSGSLYGVTSGGTALGSGTVYQLTPPPAGQTAWTETTLWTFSHGADGGVPSAGLIAGPGGMLYGTTARYGANGFGTVFMLTPPASGATAWTLTTIWNFTNGADGANPLASLLIDGAGNLYGTASRGGGNTAIGGTVFELSPPQGGAGAWTETTLWAFSGPDGTYPSAPLIADKVGNIYGTTPFGGASGQGVVFELSPPAQGGAGWTNATLWNFNGATDGAYPFSGIIADKTGALYGTTYGYAVTTYASIPGGIFRLAPPAAAGQAWSFTQLTKLAMKDGYDLNAPLSLYLRGLLISTAQQVGNIAAGGNDHATGAVFTVAGTGFAR
jgi:uncharacterized repeat protein (TIGR03803 family)